jgi:CelD/BcsL family acetyltransferase involved in cellulose biosynthesis
MEDKCRSQIESRFFSPDDKHWMEFVALNPQATVFHHPAWLKPLAECYGFRPFIIAVSDSGGRVLAGLPVMEIRSPMTGRRWVSLPFTDYCPPLYDDLDALVQLTQDLAFLYQTHKVPRIEIRWELPDFPPIQSYPAYYLHGVKLVSDSQVVLKRFERTHRQNIGTAENRGVHIERGTESEHLHRFYQLQLETRRRKGLPVQPRKFFDLLGKQILAQGLGFILLAYKDTQCLAGGFFMNYQQTLTYKYAASSGEDQQYRPNNLLSWTAMRWGCENGYTVFDLGRTELENAGLRRFKKGWGAKETPLTYSMLSTMPPKKNNGKLKSIMEKVIQKTPPWVCRVTGELLYRHFD